jgi:hypothetical protein
MSVCLLLVLHLQGLVAAVVAVMVVQQEQAQAAAVTVQVLESDRLAQ